MTDITMCKDTKCPQNERCYRYVALPNDRWQSYFVSSPKQMDGCPYYWPIKELNDESRNRHQGELDEDE